MIITLTGASGSGKTAIAKELFSRLPNAEPLISYTTRAARPSDLPGDFAYLDQQTFDRMRDDGSFVWTAAVADTRYGTTKESLHAALMDHKEFRIMILVPSALPHLYAYADEIGMRDQIRSFVISVPSEETLRSRMTARGDAPADIEKRITACATFEKDARVSEIPFLWIDNSGELSDAVDEILRHLPTS